MRFKWPLSATGAYRSGVAVLVLSLCAALVGPVAVGQTFGMRHRGMAPMTVTSSIPTGSVLETAPTVIVLRFAPAMRLDKVELTDERGRSIVTEQTHRSAAESVSVTFEPLPPGSYTLRYAADAGDHMMPGAFRFIVR
jgi:hypothetical protein